MFEWYGCLLYLFLVSFAKSPKEGSQTTLFCLLDESLDESTGGFFKVDTVFTACKSTILLLVDDNFST
jgi:hypothetical protein